MTAENCKVKIKKPRPPKAVTRASRKDSPHAAGWAESVWTPGQTDNTGHASVLTFLAQHSHFVLHWNCVLGT